jgi:predicted hydrocarbon binding protein
LRSTAALEENIHEVVKLPPFEMLYQGIPVVTSMYNQLTGQAVSLHKEAGMVILENPACPFCWGRNDQDHPVCFMFVGMMRAGLTWIYSELDYQIKEASCCAMGDQSCTFKLHI